LICDQRGASGLMSTIVPGRITSSFIKSIRVVPPASTWTAAPVGGRFSSLAARA